MATLWFKWLSLDYCVHMESLEHAYYVGSRLFTSPASYMDTVKTLHSKSVSLLGTDQTLKVYVYYGYHTPPVKEEWFPNGLRKVTLTELMEHRECKVRLFKTRLHRAKPQSALKTLKRTK